MLEIQLEDEPELEIVSAPRPVGWERAIRTNNQYAEMLGWKAYKYAIVRLLGFPSSIPDDRTFAIAVARWQKQQGGLKVDGIIGPKTLPRMQARLKTMKVLPGDDPSRAVAIREAPSEASDQFRFYRELKSEVGQEAAEKFFTETVAGIPEGHQSLTRNAAAGLPAIGGRALGALLDGVKRVDDITRVLIPADQRRHMLRGSVCQRVADAHRDAVRHFRDLHRTALTSAPSDVQFAWIGEALHLLQDSFSSAHAERRYGGPGGVHPIVFIRVYWPVSVPFPVEHAVPVDPRDTVRGLRGPTVWAREAITVSRAFLTMMLRHLASPGSPAISKELATFIARHLPLSSRHVKTSLFYPAVCP